MKNLFLITGASRGIGRGIVEEISDQFKDEKNLFVLVSRNMERLKEVKRVLFIDAILVEADLSSPLNAVKVIEEKLRSLPEDFDRYVLVNNAGVIEPVGFLGEIENKEVEKNINVNLLSSLLLTNTFLSVFKNKKREMFILNISSGAGRMPIVCWSAYCASKAGMDMFSKVLQEENSNVRVFSIAPGIVETDMQKVIRSLDRRKFPLIDNFVRLKEEGMLKSVDKCAREIVSILKNPDKFETIVSF